MNKLLTFVNSNDIKKINSLIKINKNKQTNFIKKLKIKLDMITTKKKIINKCLIVYKRHSYNYIKKNLLTKIKINNTIFYRIILNINYTNVFINIINNLNEQVCSFSLGYTQYKSLDKITKKYLLLKILKKLLLKTKKKKFIAVHSYSNYNNYNKLIINFLKNYYFIQILKFYNYLPHNGCRPKKKRRK